MSWNCSAIHSLVTEFLELLDYLLFRRTHDGLEHVKQVTPSLSDVWLVAGDESAQALEAMDLPRPG